jgi:hypothetical protein
MIVMSHSKSKVLTKVFDGIKNLFNYALGFHAKQIGRVQKINREYMVSLRKLN